jgi:hypothetical protein
LFELVSSVPRATVPPASINRSAGGRIPSQSMRLEGQKAMEAPTAPRVRPRRECTVSVSGDETLVEEPQAFEQFDRTPAIEAAHLFDLARVLARCMWI